MNLAAARTWLVRRLPALSSAGDTIDPRTHCANCGEAIVGAFCPRCGQETTLALPTARAFLREAAGRYIAWDGRTWRTLAVLFCRPGFLTCEYLAGRRRRYVRPGRLFIVLSLAFFAVIRFTSGTPEVVRVGASPEGADAIRHQAAERGPGGISLDENLVISLGEGDNVAWLAPLRQRIAQFNALSRAQKSEQLWAGMLRYGPYAMIVLLPIFAGLMKLAYLGRARRYPQRPRRYAAHLVYAAHNHAFASLALIAWNLVRVEALQSVLALWMAVYFVRSMKTVYGGRWSGVVLRALLIAACYLVLFVIAVLGLLVAAIALR
jgi:hypothetical protein